MAEEKGEAHLYFLRILHAFLNLTKWAWSQGLFWWNMSGYKVVEMKKL